MEKPTAWQWKSPLTGEWTPPRPFNDAEEKAMFEAEDSGYTVRKIYADTTDDN